MPGAVIPADLEFNFATDLQYVLIVSKQHPFRSEIVDPAPSVLFARMVQIDG
jgi:hypothetical protein